MSKDLNEIRSRLKSLLLQHQSVLKITTDSEDKFEVAGTIATMQGKKKVDGIYFATVMMKPKDVRFYFFPAYTHKEQLGELPEDLKKALKGKSCFHIKQMDDDMEEQLRDLIKRSVDCYQADGLLAK